MPTVASYIKQGRLNAIAVAGDKRSPAWPDIPTIAELGVPDFNVSSWYGILAPAKTYEVKQGLLILNVYKNLAGMDINGASAIVTGGASGIGAASARLLAAKGAKVVVADLQEEKGRELADEIGGAFCKVDVTNTDDIMNAVEMAKSMGPLRVLVNSAGIGWAQRTVGKGGYDTAANLDAFKKVIAINLVGSFDCIRLAATAMATTEPLAHGERGAIVNIASVAAFDGQIGQASYSASKGGVVGMTLPIARDLSRELIRVCTIAPGLFKTPLLGSLPEEAQKSLGKQVPHPARLGDPDECGALAIHIVENPMLNGEVIRLDGAIRMAPR